MTKIENKVYELVKPIIEGLGYEVYDVIYEKEAQENYLRIFIDKSDGIGINDCEIVNNAITDLLDEKDYIKNAYNLEVSSPGLERRLRSDEQLKKYIGQKIEVHCFKNEILEDGSKQKVLVGKLLGFDDTGIEIEISTAHRIDKSNISSMKTVYNWEED